MRLVLLFAVAAGVVHGHRLDEYLQATVLSIEQGHLRGELRMTPGVAVLPEVLALIDADRDGGVSGTESRAYADRVIGDLRLSVDGRPQEVKRTAIRFPPMPQIREGLGVIEIDFTVAIAARGSHQVSFTNLHQRPISVYLVNCLAPGDPTTRIDYQYRNYEQSEYRVGFSQGSVTEAGEWLVAAALAGLLLLRWISVRLSAATVAGA